MTEDLIVDYREDRRSERLDPAGNPIRYRSVRKTLIAALVAIGVLGAVCYIMILIAAELSPR